MAGCYVVDPRYDAITDGDAYFRKIPFLILWALPPSRTYSEREILFHE
ncbi:hypothetical protein F11_01175 [Rhodospirillum rubrum F11]|nr:hypothetical protein F11_01175 [Rhodospirillum rubrum F11]